MKTLEQDEIMVPQLFDALPESVLFFKPLTDNQNNVIDFEVVYCNWGACELLQVNKEQLLGERVLDTRLIEDDYKKVVYQQCLDVLQSGNSAEETYYSKKLNKYFSALRSKVLGGVISISRDRTEYYKAESEKLEQANRFNSILDASVDGIMVLESIRDENNEVIDFKITHCNEAGYKLGRFPPNLEKSTLLSVLPHLRYSHQFLMHRHVVETGEPVRLETTFRNENGQEFGWFIVSLSKLGDSVVSTFVDISEKKQNEQKIEEQSGLLNSIFEASINGIFACEALRNTQGEIVDLTIIKINKAFTHILSITAEEAEGQNYLSVFPLAREHGFFDYYCNVIETGESAQVELYYQGQLNAWYKVQAVKRGANGIVITFNDITESKQNKLALEDAASNLADLIENSQTGIVLLKPVKNDNGDVTNFIIKKTNQVLGTYANKSRDQLEGKLLTDAIAGSNLYFFLNNCIQIFENNETELRYESHIQMANQVLWFDTLIKKREEDLLITFLDISPVKNLQVEIAELAQKLSTVVNTAQTGMFTLQPLTDAMGNVIDFTFGIVNQAVANYIGKKAENLRGATASIHFPAYKSNGLFEIYRDTYVNNTKHLFDFHYDDELDKYFNIHVVKAGDEVLVTFSDHTSLKKLQVELEASIEELKQTNANLEEFAYAASHDLQEPLRKIQYFSERLRKVMGERLNVDEGRMFERMENASRRMSHLINDLLTYSQISRKKGTFNPVSITEILQQVLNDLEPTIQEKSATIHYGDLPVVKGDALQLRQLVQNILSNSLKYSKSNEAPVVTINCKTVEVINGTSKLHYQITITDNGIGFEQEHAEKIFKVFQRLHGQSEYPGTGIGLAIVQKVVQNHNGHIYAESAPGKGATFTVSLPVSNK